ncbi:DUF4129 domain-containing protein [Melittangium boletus]|uniref:Protein-glutamine gamma-glutamyltransferase-like C-terminal domain-containing protein n=1 Tax=Melittangium boletus DSM 14713 TaxID=1294270 RepID=A0A250IL02_9BACT|nr:DUF4129 domain-containing protein [Melittangium boletus]ATB31857.1 hypothetical protein MEBOL_005326 [Melittangium boletus DSM 14713]
MAVSALELRPRGAVAILDAALRVCVRSAGVWALTLPGGALVTAALLHLTDAVMHHRALELPALGFTLAWLARGLFQGAACHHVQELLLGTGAQPPTAWASLRAALARTPSLLCAVAYLFLFNLLSLSLTLGCAFFFLSSHLVGYAAALRGRGSPLGLYGQCGKLLGPARGNAVGVRVLLLVQGLVFINLHIAANALLYVGRKLLGIDLTFVERFASLDNTAWTVFLVAATFTLFEPLRAATATLLLVDGRVRQEGLDLIAAVQQLPVRKAALVLAALLGTGLFAPPARAEEPPLRERVEGVMGVCEEVPEEDWAHTLDSLGPEEALKFERLVRSVEKDVYDGEECEALGRLEQGIVLAAQTVALERQQKESAQARARDILARPEFQVPEPQSPQDSSKELVPPEPPGLWQRFLDWLGERLKEFFNRKETAPRPPRTNVSGGQSVANALVAILIAGALGVLAWVLWRSLAERRRADGDAGLEVSTQDAATLAADPMNALSRPPEGWAHLADTLAARGEYREAVRGLYLALLSRLHREGVIHYDSHASNWDYLLQFRGRTEWKPPFRELTLRFDFAWYGNLPVGPDGYREFRELCAPMLAPPAPTEPARA